MLRSNARQKLSTSSRSKLYYAVSLLTVDCIELLPYFSNIPYKYVQMFEETSMYMHGEIEKLIQMTTPNCRKFAQLPAKISCQ